MMQFITISILYCPAYVPTLTVSHIEEMYSLMYILVVYFLGDKKKSQSVKETFKKQVKRQTEDKQKKKAKVLNGPWTTWIPNTEHD